MFETGNKGAMKTKEQGEIWGEAWLTPEHLYHFSERTLETMIAKTGFEKIKLVKRHIVDQNFSDENLVIKRESGIKWQIKRILLFCKPLRWLGAWLLRSYFVIVRKADTSTLIYYCKKKK